MNGPPFFRGRHVPICLLLLLVLAGAAEAGAVRIMPLGDSITYGTWGYGDTRSVDLITGYRQALFLALGKAGHSVEFVGTLSAGGAAAPAFDPRHEGRGGWRDDQIAASIFAWLTANPAEIVLLHIGTNGLDSSPKDVERILDEIKRFSGDTIVVLARIINRKTYSALTTQFNDNVEAMAKDRIRNGDRIVLVDMEAALDYGKDMNDDLHPNQGGYDKMAKVWLAALLEMLPLPSPPRLAAMPTVNAWIDQELRLQLQGTGHPAPSFSLLNPPAGMSIDEESGLLKWRPTMEESRTVAVRAQNIAGSDRLDLKLKVRAAPMCPEQLTAVWPLDEEVNPFFELFHRTPVGDCAGKCPSPVAGRIDFGQLFSQERGVDLSLGAQAPAGSFSLSLWLRRSTSLRSDEHLLNGETGSARWSIELTAEGIPRAVWQAPGRPAVQVVGVWPLADGDWHHLLAIFDFGTGNLHLRVDGEEDGTASGLSSNSAATTILHLGRSSRAGVDAFAGELDEVAIFKDALSLSAAELVYARGAVGLGICRYTQELPKITSTPVLRGTVGQSWHYQVTATGLPQPIFTLVQSPAGMSIAVESGRISWTPASAGAFPVTIRASNINGQAEQKFTLDIEPPPAPPEFRSTAPTNLAVGENYRYTILLAGYPAPTLTLVKAPSGMTLSKGLLDWTPTASGNFPVTLRASNASGQTEQSFNIQVEPPPAPPVFRSAAPTRAVAGESYRYSLTIDGYPAPTLTLIDPPSGMLLSNGQIAWTPAAIGDYRVIIHADNASGQDVQSFIIQVEPPPAAPFFYSTPPAQVVLDGNYQYAIGIDGYPAPILTLVNPPSGMTLSSGRINWQPTAVGIYPVTIQGANASGLAEQSFSIQVATPPLIDSIPALANTAGLPYRYRVSVSGYPEPHLLLITAPAGMSIDGEELLWTSVAPGDYFVVLAAINPAGRAEQSFTIQVLPPPQPPRILSVPALTAPLGQNYSYPIVSEGYPPPAITLVSGPSGMAIDADHRLLWRPTTAGRYEVHLRAQSSSGIAEQNFVIEVPRSWNGRLDDWWRKVKKRWRKWF